MIHINTAFLIYICEKGGVFLKKAEYSMDRKTFSSILIGFLFCAIIWTSPGSISQAVNLGFDSPVLIIDPGHGGEDGGAVSLDGTHESVINLDIAQKLKCICDFLDIPSILTHETNTLNYPDSATTTAQRKRWDTNQRVNLIHSIPHAFLLSIHQNIYPTPVPKGSQVLYGAGDSSKEFGQLLHDNLVKTLDPGNRRVAMPANRDIYIMTHAGCTAALVECGFLSHPEESVLLNTHSYKLKIATVLAGSVLQYWEDKDESQNSVLLHGVR